jgi:hypothetical protein
MISRFSGGCLCGHVTYEYAGSVGPANYCHCEDCRRCTGSAFNIGVRLLLADFRIISGSPKGFMKRGDSGRELTRHFCPNCGSPLFTSSPEHPDHIYVKAGTFDNPSVVRPTHQNWAVSAVSWSQIPAGLQSFANGPESDNVQSQD